MPFISCVTRGKLFALSEPQFSHLCNGVNDRSPSFRWAWPHSPGKGPSEPGVGCVSASSSLPVSALVQNTTCRVPACPGSWTWGQPNVVSAMRSGYGGSTASPALGLGSGFQSHQHIDGGWLQGNGGGHGVEREDGVPEQARKRQR